MESKKKFWLLVDFDYFKKKLWFIKDFLFIIFFLDKWCLVKYKVKHKKCNRTIEDLYSTNSQPIQNA